MENGELPLTQPSYTPARLLSDFLAGNRKILERIVRLGAESAGKRGLHHVLLVGPTGSGKTHLAALAAARLEKRSPASTRPLLARLPEETWGITSFADLLLLACRALDRRGKFPGLSEALETLGDLPPDRVAQAAASLLRDAAGDRTLLLILENTDQVFAALGEEGQKEFRAFLQQDPFTAVLATSRRLFDAVTRRTSPFYGFFRVEHLAPLSPQEALALAGKVLGKLVKGRSGTPASRPEAAAWIRAVQHISLGNVRLCLLFSLGLARGETFTRAFFDALDRVLPLYLGKAREASPQQRKILDHLAGRGGAVQVKEIARECLATEQTVSSQLRELRKSGLVTVTRVGRNSFYEVSDPVLRICMAVRRGDARRVKDTMEFLSHWFRPEGAMDTRLQEAFRLGLREGRWEKAPARLLQDCKKKGTLCDLGAALVRTTPGLTTSQVGEEGRRKWISAWKGKGPAPRELALPLRLLEAALQEKAAPLSPAFLALPVEVREILRPLLPA